MLIVVAGALLLYNLLGAPASPPPAAPTRPLRSVTLYFAAACPLFVPLAEEGWADHEIARLAAAEYLAPLLREQIDTLVLGCTHYPLLKRTLQALVGETVTLIDSAEETAKTVAALLAAQGLARSAAAAPAPPRYFVTDAAERFERVGGAFLGAPLVNVTTVSLD